MRHNAERYGAALPTAIVLSVVGEGVPLIYNGQEAGEGKRLKLFERDPIDWQPHPTGDLLELAPESTLNLGPWHYRVSVQP